MQQTPFNVRDYLMILFRRKWIFVSLFILCLIGGVIYVIFAPRAYMSSSLIYIQREDILNPLLDRMAVSSQFNEQIRTIRERMLSWPRLAGLTDSLKMTANVKTPLAFEKYLISLRSKIEVTMYNQELVRISYEDKDPFLAKQVVEYLTNSFIDDTMQVKSDEAVKAIDFIRSQLEVYRNRLESSERDLGEMKVKAEVDRIESQKHLIEEQLSKQEKIVISEVKKEQNPVIKQLNERIGDLEKQLSKLLIDSTENHPLVKELRKELARTKEKLAVEMDKSQTINVEEKSATNPIYAELEQQLKILELRRNTLLQKQAEIKEKSSKYKLGPISEAELSAMDRDAQVNETLYSTLLSKLETARISQQLENVDKDAKFKVIDPARMPLKPSKPDIFKSIMMSIFMGLGLGVFGMYAAEYMDHSIRNVEDAKAFFDKPLMGAISRIELDEDAAKKVRQAIRG